MTNKQTIIILIQSLRSGGAERQACLLAKQLSNSNDVTLVCRTLHQANEYNLSLLKGVNITVKELSSNNILSFILELYHILKTNSTNIIFSYLLWGNFWGGIIGKLAGVKYRFGGIRSSRIDKNKEFLNRVLQNRVNHLTIYNNHNGRDYYSHRGFNIRRSIVIPNAIAMTQKELKRNVSDQITILSVGRFVPVKDYGTALDVIYALSQKHENVKYILVGYGSEEEAIRSKVQELGVSHQVELHIDPKNIRDYYEAADIYFQTSLFEGLSNTVMEAMSYSLPCVVTDVGDNAKLIQIDKGGYITRVGDKEEMLLCLSNLCTDYQKRIAYGLNNYKKISKEYSVEAFQQKYFDLIDSLVL